MSLKFGPGVAAHWGTRRESGIWLASTSRRRLLLPWSSPRHRAVYIAAGRLRVRVITRNTMKPERASNG